MGWQRCGSTRARTGWSPPVAPPAPSPPPPQPPPPRGRGAIGAAGGFALALVFSVKGMNRETRVERRKERTRGHHQSINPLRQKNPLTRPLSFSSLLRRVPLCLQRRRKAEGGSDDFYCNSGPNLAYYIVYTLCPLRHAILATSVHLDMQFWRAILAMFGWEVKNFVPRLLNEVYLQKHFHR